MWTGSIFLWDICSEFIANLILQFGGVGDTVEIDECTIGRKRKYGREDIRGLDQWVFGMDERRRGFAIVKAVENRTAATLLLIIYEHVQPGTTIHNDQWAAYNTLPRNGYHHRTVSHSEEFVAEDYTHTNRIVGLWSNLREEQRIRRGTNLALLQSHFDEFFMLTIARTNKMDMFELILQEISRKYRE